MRTMALLCMLLSLWAQPVLAVGPAAVVRPLDATLPLPPEPTISTTDAPAPTVAEPTPPLPSLPTEAELRAMAEAEAEAKRPPLLQPIAKPQRVETLGKGHFLILPAETPLQTNGTIHGGMFRDETETLKPLPSPHTVEEPTFADDMATVRDEMRAIQTDLTGLVARLHGGEGALATVVISNTLADAKPLDLESPAKPPVPPPAPKPVPPKPLNLPYMADATAPATAKVQAWAKTLPTGRAVHVKVITQTLAPPLGTTATDVALARWRAVREVLSQQGIQLGRVSFVHLKGEPQKLTVRVE